MRKNRKGIILAGGSAKRLYPTTLSVSKQLLPIYDKPMIYYALSVLMEAEIKQIAIIVKKEDLTAFEKLLGNGAQWGISITFLVQPEPRGLAEAYIISENFLEGAPSLLILGDNIFYGNELKQLLLASKKINKGGQIFGYRVSDPERYGVINFDNSNKVISIDEKPKQPISNFVITGLYFLDERAPSYAKTLKPSKRGELEMTDLLQIYLEKNNLGVRLLDRGYAWLDTGLESALLSASNFVKTLQDRQGLLVGSPEEVAFKNNWITRRQLQNLTEALNGTSYGKFLNLLLRDK